MRNPRYETLQAVATELIEFMESWAGGKIFDDDEVWRRFRRTAGRTSSKRRRRPENQRAR